MAFTTIFEDIVFVEGDFPGAVRYGAIKSDMTRGFGTQLKSLADIKHKLADLAKKEGANAVLDFEYGQKSRWFLSFDSVGYWGKGVSAVIPQSDYEKIKSSQQN